jgi:hypothetical protein
MKLKLLTLALLIGWVLLSCGAFLIVEFPNAGWNHGLSLFVWVLLLGLTVATIGFCFFVVVRLIFRLARKIGPQDTSHEQPPNLHSQSKWPRGLAIGCIAFLVAAALLVVIEHQIKSSPLFQVSVAQARESPEVVGALGEPVVVGWLVSGQITESSDGGGHATLTIPLEGPKGKGRLRVEAWRRADHWRLSALQFVSGSHNSTADLLAPKGR